MRKRREYMKQVSLGELTKIAALSREDIIEMLVREKAGHPAGSLGMTDVFVALYFAVLNHDPAKPDWEERDRLILSNGHICPARYAVMARAGYFPEKELKTFGHFQSILQGHPDKRFFPSLETTSGPLGSGLAQAAGISYAARMDGKRFRVYCICSDGEHEEGNHWEAVAFAGKNSLSNLTLIVDRNNIQIDGFTEDVMPLEPLADKYKAFNWSVIEVDGHNIMEIVEATNKARAIYANPTVIIAHTIPGKGVDFMENNYKWHSKTLTPEEAKEALKDIRTLKNQVKEYGE